MQHKVSLFCYEVLMIVNFLCLVVLAAYGTTFEAEMFLDGRFSMVFALLLSRM